MTARARRHRQEVERLALARRNASTILGLMLTGISADELVGVTRSPEMSKLAVETAVALAQSVQRDIKLLVLTLTGRVPDVVLEAEVNRRVAPEPDAGPHVGAREPELPAHVKPEDGRVPGNLYEEPWEVARS